MHDLHSDVLLELGRTVKEILLGDRLRLGVGLSLSLSLSLLKKFRILS